MMFWLAMLFAMQAIFRKLIDSYVHISSIRSVSCLSFLTNLPVDSFVIIYSGGPSQPKLYTLIAD